MWITPGADITRRWLSLELLDSMPNYANPTEKGEELRGNCVVAIGVTV
jgi:hypothetical protein